MTERLIALNRRRFLALATGMVAAGLLPRRVLAYAGPKVVTVGGVEVTVLSDGLLYLPAAVLAPDADPAALQALLAGAKVVDGNLELTALPVLLREGDQTVLVDMGAGAGFQASAGRIMESLAAAGVDPASVTKVVFTHGHPDHLFGATKDGALQLPGADYAVGGTEWDFWMNPGIFDMLPKEMHGMAQGAQANFSAIEPKLTKLKAGDAVLPGVAVIDTPGHTPGHISLEIAGGDGAIVLGDVIPSSLVHFAHPEWRMAFDGVPEQAVATRKMLLDRAVAEKKLLIGYHWPEPLGRAEAADGAFRFVAG